MGREGGEGCNLTGCKPVVRMRVVQTRVLAPDRALRNQPLNFLFPDGAAPVAFRIEEPEIRTDNAPSTLKSYSMADGDTSNSPVEGK